MSLLEDVFLQDEANEARELERVIEGDEYDERARSLSPSGDESDRSKRDDEAEEDKRRVDPSSTKTKRVIKNPRFVLNPARLTGPRGIQVIPEHFKDFKFKGKGHEKEDLDMVLKKLEHWAYRLYPKFQFTDCLKKIEILGRKRPVMVHLHKIRSDQYLSEDTIVQKDSSDDEPQQPQEEDEFDKLLQQQIELARATPAPGSIKKPVSNDQWQRLIETPKDNRSPLTMPKATSSPSISEEQKERMIKNRKLAEERRLARLKQATNNNGNKPPNSILEEDEELSRNKDNTENNNNENVISKKINRSNVIDSSDEDESNVITISETIAVDIHSNTNKDKADNGTIHIDHDTSTVDSMTIDDERNSHKNASINIIESASDDEIPQIGDKTNVNIDNMVVDEQHSKINENIDVIEAIDVNIDNTGNNDNDINYVTINNDENIKMINNEMVKENYVERNTEINNVTENVEATDENEPNDDEIKEVNGRIKNVDEPAESGELTSVIQRDEDEIVEDVMDVDFSEDF